MGNLLIQSQAFGHWLKLAENVRFCPKTVENVPILPAFLADQQRDWAKRN